MKINGKEYAVPTLNFTAVCRLEEWGLSVDNLSSRPLALLAGFIALAIGGSTLEDGEAAIDAHLSGGGSLVDMTAALNKAIGESGFFAARTIKD